MVGNREGFEMKVFIEILALLAVASVLTVFLNGEWWHIFIYAILFGWFAFWGFLEGVKDEEKKRNAVIKIWRKQGWLR